MLVSRDRGVCGKSTRVMGERASGGCRWREGAVTSSDNARRHERPTKQTGEWAKRAKSSRTEPEETQPEALGDKWARVSAWRRTTRSAVLAQVAKCKQREPPKARLHTMSMASGSDGIWQASFVRETDTHGKHRKGRHGQDAALGTVQPDHSCLPSFTSSPAF